MPNSSSVSAERSFLRRLISETLIALLVEARDHPRKQALDAVHARPLPAEVIADVDHVEAAALATGRSVTTAPRVDTSQP